MPQRLTSLILALTLVPLAVTVAQAQAGPDASSSRDTGAERTVFEFSLDAGWAFRLPEAHVTLGPTGGELATARLGASKVAPSAGVRLWANRWLGVSVDVLGLNRGRASTELNIAQANIKQYLFAAYFGAEAQRPRGSIRPYVQFGGGPLRFSQETAFSDGFSWTRISQRVTAGSLRAGGGVRFMCSPRWGVKLGAEVLHFSANAIGAHTFGRTTAGVFFQTRGRPAY